ncbi:Acyl-[acyl-carrier-protein]--UDP-N-acetylglucosamine O-acyltransferase [Minicystis rosea]|nr:Acyl-[acyl-carrier-protein]--UDP-N-acetylglucosamine O-acyltransferase [Minicystis rosea]
MSEGSVHPTALVAPDATLEAGVSVGPFAIIEPGVVVGEGTRIDAHAVIRSGTRMGARNVVHPFAVIGGDPQERTYAGQPTRLEIGDGNVFREHVTVHRGSPKGGGLTRIGSACLFMASVHVAHDCILGDRIELANGTLLAGHVIVGDFVVAGGSVAVAPFVRIGTRAFLAAGAMVERDVPPFVIAAGDRARVRALNRVGLVRSGVPEASQAALERGFRAVFRRDTPRAVAAATIAEDPDPYVRELAAALKA